MNILGAIVAPLFDSLVKMINSQQARKKLEIQAMAYATLVYDNVKFSVMQTLDLHHSQIRAVYGNQFDVILAEQKADIQQVLDHFEGHQFIIKEFEHGLKKEDS